MKNELNELMKSFVKECESIGQDRWPSQYIEPSFENFIRWLNDETWNMK